MEKGFSVEGLYADVAGTPYDHRSNEFTVTAGRTCIGTDQCHALARDEWGRDVRRVWPLEADAQAA